MPFTTQNVEIRTFRDGGSVRGGGLSPLRRPVAFASRSGLICSQRLAAAACRLCEQIRRVGSASAGSRQPGPDLIAESEGGNANCTGQARGQTYLCEMAIVRVVPTVIRNFANASNQLLDIAKTNFN
jgi:hypothetical protein